MDTMKAAFEARSPKLQIRLESESCVANLEHEFGELVCCQSETVYIVSIVEIFKDREINTSRIQSTATARVSRSFTFTNS